MCTAITWRTADHYFGRNLDLERSFGEAVTVTPRHFAFVFPEGQRLDSHYAMIGMAHVANGYPLYYDATNEKGLSMAGLYFPGNAVYGPARPGKDNIPVYAFLPWVLGQCETIAQVKALLARLNLTDTPFSPQMPAAPLHWLAADKDSAIVIEAVAEGLQVYDDPAGVLTNNPPFPFHRMNLNNYMALTPHVPENRFAPQLPLAPYCQGMGGLGLPGDVSSASRFVRAAFTKMNAVAGPGEAESVGQFFHILDAVAYSRGCARTAAGDCDITVYSSCCNTDKGIYYYTTYENRQITAVDMHREDLDGSAVAAYPLITSQQIRLQNG